MAAVAPSASGGLTPEMIAAIQAAANAGAGAATSHDSASGIDAAMDTSLSGSNLFTPQEISSVESQWVGGSTPWGNGAPETSNWDQMMQTAVQQALPGQGQSTQSQSAYGTPSQIASAQPLPYSSFGSIPQISPTYTTPATATTVNDPMANPMMTQADQNQYEAMVTASLDPTFQAQQDAQNQAMAARGIFNSSAAQDAQTQLQGTQSATLAGAYAPIIQQGMTGQQQAMSQNASAGNTTNLANAAAANSANQYNATAANQATAGNAATQLGITQGDQSNYNAFEQALLNQGATQGGNVYQTYLNSMNPQAVTSGATSTLGQGATNATNAATTAGANTNTSGLSSAISNVFAGPGSRNTGSTTGGNLNGYYSQLDSSGGQ